jgi:hypothetical protein
MVSWLYPVYAKSKRIDQLKLIRALGIGGLS